MRSHDAITFNHALRWFQEVHNGELWEWYQNQVRKRYLRGVIAAMQLYSDKTLLNLVQRYENRIGTSA